MSKILGIEDIQHQEGWQKEVSWPMSFQVLMDKNLLLQEEIFSYFNAITTFEEMRIVMSLWPHFKALVQRIGEATVLADACLKNNYEPRQEDPLLSAFYNDEELPAVAKYCNPPGVALPSYVRLREQLRRALHKKENLFKAVIKSEEPITVISHTPLLLHAAKKQKNVRFSYAEKIIHHAARVQGSMTENVHASQFVSFCESLLQSIYLTTVNGLRTKALSAFEKYSSRIVRQVLNDISRLSKVKSLPENVWCGSAGNYATRLVSLEVMARGGKVRRFEHGCMQCLLLFDMIELPACTDYVNISKEYSEITHHYHHHKKLSPFMQPKVHYEHDFNVLGTTKPSKSTKRTGKKKVMYVGTILSNMRPKYPCLVPDILYVEFTDYVLNLLKQQDLDIVLKPHPESMLKNGLHPLDKQYQIEYGRFEDCYQDVDLFIFDEPTSSTFPFVLCGDKPIVLLNLNMPKTYNSYFYGLLEKRCTILQSYYDEQNRLRIDDGKFINAVKKGDKGEMIAEISSLYYPSENETTLN